MNKKRVWHPNTSLSQDDECEERGRGSLAGKRQQDGDVVIARKTKAKLPRRRTPTVDMSAIMNAYPKRQVESNSNASTPGSTYDTIESRTGPSFLECSSIVYHHTQCPPTTRSGWDFCGWRERESLDSYRHEKTTSSHTSSGVLERRDLSTPADNFRPAVRASVSRYSSSYGYRRRNDYEFKHLTDTHQYINHYRQTCSYTTYMTSQNTSSTNDRELYEPEEVEQDPYNTMPIGVKSWYRGGDPYLREIVSRLGVRDVSREQQLLKSPKPTPPSIVKRSKNRADLVVRANGKTGSHEDILLPTGENSFGTSSQNSPKPSRPVSCSIGVGSLELPTIAQTTHIRPPSQRADNRNKNSSVISVNKYLQVTSHNTQSLNEEEEEDGINGSETERDKELACGDASGSLDSFSSEILAQHFSREKMVPNSNYDGTPIQIPKPTTLTVQQQMLYMDSSQREKLISNKAHSLGLISRDWSHMRRTLNGKSQTAAPPENSEDYTGYRYTLFMRSSKRQNKDSSTQRRRSRIDNATGQLHHDSTHEQLSAQSNPQREHHRHLPPSRPKTRAEDVKKLERLKSIYEPSSKRSLRRKNDPTATRQPSRCESRATSRAQTRAGFRRQSSKPRVPSRYVSSRPVTRAADTNFQRTVRGRSNPSEEQEGSTYWNELPIKPRHSNPKSRPVTGRNKLGQATNTHQVRQHKQQVLTYHHTEGMYPRTMHKQNTVVVGTRC